MATKRAPSRVRVYGLTGMIGSGKSTAASILEALGARIIDADMLAREAVRPGSKALEKIAARFGAEVIGPDGELDRKRMGRIAFGDEASRLALEGIVHPEVRRLFAETLEAARQEKSPPRLVIYAIPLLFESKNRHPELEKTILVAAPKEACLARIMARDRLTRAEAEARYAAQMPEDEKRKRADVVVENDGTVEELEEKLREVFAVITR